MIDSTAIGAILLFLSSLSFIYWMISLDERVAKYIVIPLLIISFVFIILTKVLYIL
jgi:hypothetical protein